jgi:hypothetical protein
LADRGRRPAGTLRFGLVAVVLAIALLVFHFTLAPFYLYQIIMILPALALGVALAEPWWRRQPWRGLLGALALVVGLVPGLAMALMGFKVTGPFELPGGRMESPWTLYPLRHPLPEPLRFYRWRFGEDPRMWLYVNRHLKDENLLTHENRHLVFDPSIRLVHLDDWEIQRLWAVEPPDERVRRLVEDFEIHYYLEVPNERACATNARMGAAEWPLLGLAELVWEAGPNRLWRLRPSGEEKPDRPIQ